MAGYHDVRLVAAAHMQGMKAELARSNGLFTYMYIGRVRQRRDNLWTSKTKLRTLYAPEMQSSNATLLVASGFAYVNHPFPAIVSL